MTLQGICTTLGPLNPLLPSAYASTSSHAGPNNGLSFLVEGTLHTGQRASAVSTFLHFPQYYRVIQISCLSGAAVRLCINYDVFPRSLTVPEERAALFIVACGPVEGAGNSPFKTLLGCRGPCGEAFLILPSEREALLRQGTHYNSPRPP